MLNSRSTATHVFLTMQLEDFAPSLIASRSTCPESSTSFVRCASASSKRSSSVDSQKKGNGPIFLVPNWLPKLFMTPLTHDEVSGRTVETMTLMLPFGILPHWSVLAISHAA